MKWIVGSATHGCWLGSYEYRKRICFERAVTRGSVVFDVGANVGFYTLLASVLVGEEGRVFAFEPVPRNLLYLGEHLRLNGLGNVTVLEAAVLDRAGTARFDDSLGASTGRVSSRGNLEVLAVSLDELIAARRIPFPDFIKIDVEGAELQVLCGARSLLREARPTLFLATHSPEAHRESCDLLRGLGYRLSTFGRESLEDTDEIMAVPGR